MKSYRAGGQMTIGAIVKWAILLPDTFSECENIINPILSQPTLVHERVILAREILSAKQQNAIINRITNQLIRPIIADQFRGNETLETQEIKGLISRSTDKLLKNDLPTSAFPKIPVNSFDKQKNTMNISLPNRGEYVICDVVTVSDQRYLIALGEVGVALVESTGKIVWHKPIPTYRIVISDNQQITLLLAPRSQCYQIHQLTIATQTILELGMLKLTAFADSFDGMFWTLSINNVVQVVDVRNNFKVVWHVGALTGEVLKIQRTATHEYWLIGGEDRQFWCYTLPERRLVSCTDAPYHINNIEIYINETFDSYHTIQDNKVTISHFNSSYQQILQLPKALSIEEKRSFKLSSQAGILTQWQQSSTSTTLFHFYTKRFDRCLELNWPIDAKPTARTEMTNWLLFDQEGRLVHIDWSKGKVNKFSLQLK
ncbi:hypothetical protein [Providencia sneebia]|uniref:hypothetical protein n=1 Tax=Providencia sneebia TaxID=516075 RepID=UPI0005C57A52|nr:hypothetical protein [Providencia sneebia]